MLLSPSQNISLDSYILCKRIRFVFFFVLLVYQFDYINYIKVMEALYMWIIYCGHNTVHLCWFIVLLSHCCHYIEWIIYGRLLNNRRRNTGQFAWCWRVRISLISHRICKSHSFMCRHHTFHLLTQQGIFGSYVCVLTFVYLFQFMT